MKKLVDNNGKLCAMPHEIIEEIKIFLSDCLVINPLGNRSWSGTNYKGVKGYYEELNKELNLPIIKFDDIVNGNAVKPEKNGVILEMWSDAHYNEKTYLQVLEMSKIAFDITIFGLDNPHEGQGCVTPIETGIFIGRMSAMIKFFYSENFKHSMYVVPLEFEISTTSQQKSWRQISSIISDINNDSICYIEKLSYLADIIKLQLLQGSF